MLTFDKLRAIFERGKKPYWTLYKGNGKGQQIGTNCLLTDDKPTLESAWDDLESLVSNYGDGVYSLECRTNPTASRGNDLHVFMVGNVEEKVNRVAGGSFQNPAIGFFQGLDARYFMERISGAEQSTNSLQLQLLQKEFEIQSLRRELKDKKEKVTTADRVFGFLEKNPQVIDRLFDGQAPAAVGVLKGSNPIPETSENRAENADEDEYEYEPGRIDLNALSEAAVRIQTALPGRHVNDVLDGLAEWIESNPKQADSYLNMMFK